MENPVQPPMPPVENFTLGNNNRRRATIIGVAIGLVLLAIIGGVLWYRESTKVARVTPAPVQPTTVQPDEQDSSGEPTVEPSTNPPSTNQPSTNPPSETPVVTPGATTNPPAPTPGTSPTTPSPTPPPATTPPATTPPVTTPPGSGPPTAPVPAQPTLVLTRQVPQEAQTLVPNNGWSTIFQWTVTGNQNAYTSQGGNVSFLLDESGLSSDVKTSLYNDTLFVLETYTLTGAIDSASAWRELGRMGFGARSGGNLTIVFPMAQNYQVKPGNRFRLRVSRLPCELSGKTIDVTMLDARNNPTMHFVNAPTTEYNETRHAIPITTCASARTAPIDPAAWLRFEEASGTFVDASGNGSNATVVRSGVLYGQTGPKTKAIHFGPTNDYVQIPVGTSARAASKIADPMSVEFMMKMDKENEWQAFVSSGSVDVQPNQYNYILAVTPDNTLGFFTEVGEAWYSTTKKLQKNVWYHIGMTVGSCTTASDGRRVGCTVKLFINGQSDTLKLYAGVHNGPTALPRDVATGFAGNYPITLGAWPGAVGTPHLFPFHGSIDEFVLYDRALYSEEMVDRYKGNL